MDQDVPSWAQQSQSADIPSWAGSSAAPAGPAAAPRPPSKWSNLGAGVSGAYKEGLANSLMIEPIRYVMEHTGFGMDQLKTKFPGQSDQWYQDRLHGIYNTAIQNMRQQADQQTSQNPYPGHQVGNFVSNMMGSADPTWLIAPGASLEKGAFDKGIRAAIPKVAQFAAKRTGIMAGVGAASDAAAQAMDMAEGVQKDFDVKRNLQSAAVTGAFGGAHAVGATALGHPGVQGAIADAPVPDFVKNLFLARGTDTTPQSNPLARTSALTGERIELNPQEQTQLRGLLKTGSVDDIKGFFQGRNGPQPTWAQLNQLVEMRDRIPTENVVNGDNVRQALDESIRAHHSQLVNDHVNALTSDWKNRPDVEVVNHVNGIKDDTVRQEAINDGVTHDNTVGFVGSDGKVRLFANQLDTPDKVNAVMFHEALGHYGLAQKFGAGLDQTLTTMLNKNVGQFAKDVNKWQQANPGAYSGNRLRAAEEVLAEASQNGPIKKSWGDALVSHVRRFGRQMGLKLSYSDAEVSHILSMAHDAVINGTDVRSNRFGGKAPVNGGQSQWLNFSENEATPNRTMTSDQMDQDVSRRAFLKGAAVSPAAAIASHAEASIPRTPLDGNAAVQRAISTGKMGNVVHAIALTSKDPSFRNIARIMDVGGMGDAKVHVLPQEPDAVKLGDTNPDTGDVRLYHSPEAESNGVTEHTALHEALHSFLAQRLFTLSTYGVEDNRARFNKAGIGPRNVDQFADHFVNEVWRPWSDMMEAKQPDLAGKGDGGAYAWSMESIRSPDELFVRSLTDPDLQNFLKSHDMSGNEVKPRDPNSWWTKLVNFFSDLLGIKRDDRNSLGTIMDASHSVLKSAALDAPDKKVANEVVKINGPTEEDELRQIGDNRFMTPEQFDKPLPITDEDVREYHKWKEYLARPGDLNGRRDFYQDLFDRAYSDVPPEIMDQLKNRNIARARGEYVPQLSKGIQVVDNRTGEKLSARNPGFWDNDLEPNRMTAARTIMGKGDDAQHFGFDRFGTDNKYMTPKQLNASIADGTYQVQQMERAYNATDRDYTPTKRGWGEVRQDALNAGFSPSQVKRFGDIGDLSKRVFQTQAAVKVLDNRISNILERWDTPDLTVGDRDNLRQALVDHAYILDKLRGDRAEIARALQMSKSGYTRAQMESFGEILRESGGTLSPLGDDETLNRFARQLKQVMAGGHNPAGVNSMISSLSKPHWEDYITTLHQNMMLSGLSTHVKAPLDMMIGIGRELLDNAGALPISAGREALRAIGVPVKPGVHPTETAARLWGVLRAAMDADTYRNTASTFVNGGYNPNGFGGKQNARIPIVSKVTDLISAQDAFFRAFATNMHLYGMGTRKALEEARLNGTPKDWDSIMTQGAAYARNPDPKMLKEAHDLANQTLLLNKNALTQPLDKLKRTTPDSTPLARAGAFIANFLTPFVRVESNSLWNRVVRRSPLAVLDPQTVRDLKAGGAQADVAMSRIAMGTASIAAYWMAAGQGKTTGEGPDSPQKKAVLQATGWRPNSVHDGDQYNTGNKLAISVNPFDVHNATASMVADLREAYEKGANKGQVATGLKLATLSMMKRLTDMSYVSDIAPAIEAFTAPNATMGDKVAQFLGDQATTMTPNLFGQAARVGDQDQRMTQVSGDISQTVKNSVMSNVPGLREQLPKRMDPFGDPVQSGASMFGEHTWLPQGNRATGGNHVNETTDPAKKELGRLNSMYEENIVSPVQRTITVGGQKVKLTNEQLSEYQRMAGHEIVETLRDEMSTPEWQQMSDDEKAEWVRDMQKDRKAAVREYLYGGSNE